MIIFPKKCDKKKGQTKEEQGKRLGDGETRRKAFEAVIIVFKELIFKLLPKVRDDPYFSWAQPMVGNSTERNQKY